MRRLLRSWANRVAVAGHSMEPTLRAGDWLLVDPLPRAAPLRSGELVVVDDARSAGRWLIKRVAALGTDGSLRLAGDNPAHAIEPALAEVPREAVVGRPWLRYWPPRRIGRVR